MNNILKLDVESGVAAGQLLLENSKEGLVSWEVKEGKSVYKKAYYLSRLIIFFASFGTARIDISTRAFSFTVRRAEDTGLWAFKACLGEMLILIQVPFYLNHQCSGDSKNRDWFCPSSVGEIHPCAVGQHRTYVLCKI